MDRREDYRKRLLAIEWKLLDMKQALVLCHSLVAWLEEDVYPRWQQANGGDLHVQEVCSAPHRSGAWTTPNARAPRQDARTIAALRSHPAQGRRRWSRALDRREDRRGFGGLHCHGGP